MTLAFYLAFYLAFACLIVNRTAGLVLMLIWTLLVFVCIPYHPQFPLSWLASPRVLEFLAGMSVAIVTVRRPARAHRLVAITGFVLFVILGLIDSYVLHSPGPWWTCLFGIAAAILIYGLARGEQAGTGPRVPRALIGLGAASYSIYLTHYPVLILLGKLLTGVPPLVAYSAAIVIATAAGIAFHLVVERPVRNCA